MPDAYLLQILWEWYDFPRDPRRIACDGIGLRLPDFLCSIRIDERGQQETCRSIGSR